MWKYLVLAAAACAGSQHPRPTEGAIVGAARDRDTGDPVARAEIHVRADGELAATRTATSASDGAYTVDHLRPGRYSVAAEFAGQPVDVEHVEVRAGQPTLVDLVFTLGHPDPRHEDFGDPGQGAISRFHPPHLAPGLALIEGTVSDASTRTPVVGASVTATGPAGTVLAITDDIGHYRFAPVPPGAYSVSAYYSVGGRGQIEIRRSDIEVDAGAGVHVPLWVELGRR